MKTKIFKDSLLWTGAILIILGATQSPVLASPPPMDDALYARLQTTKQQLQSSEQKLWRDIENLRFQIHNAKDQYDVVILQRKLDDKYRDLDQVEYSLRDVSQLL
jgi:hypothetical protein